MRWLVCLAVVVTSLGCGGKSARGPGALGQGAEAGRASDTVPDSDAQGGAPGVGGAAGLAFDMGPLFLSECESDTISTRGKWYAVTNIEGVARINPATDLGTPFRLEEGSYDGTQACHVAGEVSGPLPEDDPRTDRCGERLYPSAAVGFGFRSGNDPFNVTGEAGIAFVARSSIDDYAVRVTVPQTTTTVPRPELADHFDMTCFCTEEAARLQQRRSCGAHYGLFLTLGSEWQLCAVYFTDMTAPSWGQDMGFDPSKVIQIQWEMQQPPGADETLPFDIWLDDVRWIRDEILGSGALIGVPLTSGCVPLDNGT